MGRRIGRVRNIDERNRNVIFTAQKELLNGAFHAG
jgi:hypothetical protein